MPAHGHTRATRRPRCIGRTRHRRQAGKEIRAAGAALGLSLAATGRHAGMSGSQVGRIERGDLDQPTVEQLCRAARAVGLSPAFQLFPDAAPVRDRGQLALLARLETVLGPPLRLRREAHPDRGGPASWDARAPTATAPGRSRPRPGRATCRRSSRRVARNNEMTRAQGW